MLILDAYNVLHCTHELPDRHALMNVAGLCRLIETSRWSRERAIVVCDGSPKPNEGDYAGPVELTYSGRSTDADSVIEALIEDADNPGHTTVVSNDRRIIRAARRRKCRTLTSERFLRLLIAQPAGKAAGRAGPEKPQGVDDADAWMAEFDIDEDAPGQLERELNPPRSPKQPADDARQGRTEPATDDAIDNSPELTDQPRAGESETDYWLREFGIEDDRERDID